MAVPRGQNSRSRRRSIWIALGVAALIVIAAAYYEVGSLPTLPATFLFWVGLLWPPQRPHFRRRLFIALRVEQQTALAGLDHEETGRNVLFRLGGKFEYLFPFHGRFLDSHVRSRPRACQVLPERAADALDATELSHARRADHPDLPDSVKKSQPQTAGNRPRV